MIGHRLGWVSVWVPIVQMVCLPVLKMCFSLKLVAVVFCDCGES